MKSRIENPKSKLIIVGAGPAGSSLAIRLARKGFEVVLIEREKFPRHKLCGEFISPECLDHFAELGVLDEMIVRGGDRISQTIFYSEKGRSVSVSSEWFGGSLQGALGLSRAEMDLRLMEKAKKLGVRVLEECSVVGLLSKEEKVCGVKVRNSLGVYEEIFADLTVDATGRKRVLSKLSKKEFSRKGVMERRKIKNTSKLVGFKTHLKNIHLERGSCEIYFFRGGYGGLSYVEDGIANHCFLIEAELVKKFKGNADEILHNVIFKNGRAKETMKHAEKLFDWLAVSVDGFGTKDLNPAPNLYSIGDSAAFIDPFTGSGMLMALESSEIVGSLIFDGAKSETSFHEKYVSLHKAKFGKRLRICSLIRKLSFSPKMVEGAISILGLSRRSIEILARSTRKVKTKNIPNA